MASSVRRPPGRRSSAARGVALALAAALGGCGPIVYASQMHDASDAIDAARAVHAEQYAPYWWTRATQYLEKAREIAAYADFQGANRFGLLATEAAQKAAEEAKLAERDPGKRPIDQTLPGQPPAGQTLPGQPPAVAPAKDGSVDPAPVKSAKPSPIAPAKDAP